MGSLEVIDDNARAGTRIISEGFNRRHKQVVDLVKKYEDDFKKIGLLKRTITKGKTKDFNEYFLNESQFLFLGSLMRNDDQVVAFKLKLIQEFEVCKKELARIQSNQTNQQWIEQRDSGKLTRHSETDVIKDFVDYATLQGSKNARMYYANITGMENRALFIVEQKHKNLRDCMGIADLSTIQNADAIVSRALRHGMDDNLNYKDIYLLAKERVELFAELRGKVFLNALPINKKVSIQ